MIKSFKDRETEKVFKREFSSKIPQDIQRSSVRKLKALHRAETINDLRNPPSNHLKILKGERKGQYSIRINRQWRICFHWIKNNAHDVEIVDYH